MCIGGVWGKDGREGLGLRGRYEMPCPTLIHTFTPLQAHACAATVNFAEGVEEEVRAGQGGGHARIEEVGGLQVV